VFRGHEGPRIAVGAANTALMVGTWLPLPGMIAAFNEVSWFGTTMPQSASTSSLAVGEASSASVSVNP
jgi:hypothetical protein